MNARRRQCKASAKKLQHGVVADISTYRTAIEHGLIWVSKDRDFARFARLRWQHPTK